MREPTLKLVWIALITVVAFVDCMGLNVRPGTNDQQLTDSDLQAARQVAIEFTTGFARTTDLAPIVADLFSKDFIERYTKAKSKALVNRSSDLYFVPGLDYNSRLLADAGPEDWLRFYTAANNFVFLGIMSGIKNSRNVADISATELYPPTVINLLNTNPTLSNMIVRKGRSKAVGSVAEMQKATATLEQAVSLMRRQTNGQPTNINEQEFIKVMQEDEFFRPTVETVDDQFFGLPQNTRVIFINTPILFRLILVKNNNNKLEILWAEPYTGG
jgi:hypothetical protein